MLKKISLIVIVITVTTFTNKILAQTDSSKSIDLFADIENEGKIITAIDYASATFKSTRIINSHSVEMIGKHNLDYRISHRFGYINTGIYDLFGLDNASMRNGLEYGITNKLNIGLGRSSIDKEFDGYVKYKLLSQSSGKVTMPISLVYLFSAMHNTLKSTKELSFTNRMAYAHQLLIARKFNENISFQLMPSLVHINAVPLAKDDNNLYSLGAGGRIKLSKRVAINAEYFYQFNRLFGSTNSASIGFDIETGGHVFQLHFTNSTGLTERTFITNTTGNWGDGDIRFGFNVARTFVTKKAKGSRNSY